jgi:hypothetical protein
VRLTLKAVGQCRATLETLAAIKNPLVVFAKQANMAHGPQQVKQRHAPDGPTEIRRQPTRDINSFMLPNV